jgi:hypothetical protein
MSNIRYGFYLRPSYAMCIAQATMHDMLRRQYGLQVAGQFMPHATIKGFFRSDAPVDTIIAYLDAALAVRQSFTIYNNGVVGYDNTGIALRIHNTPDGAKNKPLQALHQSTLDALLPLVHPDCEFTQQEWFGPRFDAHLTLAMTDIPPQFFDEILHFVREAEPIGPAQFVASVFQLFAFTSEDWAGHWWKTLEWQLLHTWQLSVHKGRLVYVKR